MLKYGELSQIEESKKNGKKTIKLPALGTKTYTMEKRRGSKGQPLAYLCSSEYPEMAPR